MNCVLLELITELNDSDHSIINELLIKINKEGPIKLFDTIWD